MKVLKITFKRKLSLNLRSIYQYDYCGECLINKIHLLGYFFDFIKYFNIVFMKILEIRFGLGVIVIKFCENVIGKFKNSMYN